MVTINDFAAIDLRVAQIVEIEDLEAARKPMYKMKVDVGELGVRTIIAGIKPWYTKEQLLNRKIVIIANLEPRNIAGVLSEGMLVAADDGAPSLLQPDRDLAPGSKIK